MTARLRVLLLCLAAAGLQAQEAVTWRTGTYVFDGSGNIESIDGRPFVYDELGRLTYGKADATHGEMYRYDGFGNIITIQKDGQVVVSLGASPATNRMSDTTANAWASYNADGSIASTVTGDTFTYDGVGMVKESKVAAMRRFYLYTPSDERIASVRIQSNNTAGNREWTIRNPSGAVLTRFTQTPAGAWSWDEDYVYAAGQLVSAKVSGPEKVRHFFPDHLGTPRLITGNGGVELSRHTYYPFGEEVTTTASTERLKFTGHERDDATLDYMHARYYAPMWGRFLSVDPARSADPSRPQSWNRYSYALNNPLFFIDPDGLAPAFFVTTTFRKYEFSDQRVTDYIRHHATGNYNIADRTATRSNFQKGLSQPDAVSIYFGHSNAVDSLTFNDGKAKVADFQVKNRVVCFAACNTAAMLDDVKIGRGQALIGVTSNLTMYGQEGFVKAGDLSYISTQIIEGLQKGQTIGEIVDQLNKFYTERGKKDPKYKVKVVLQGDRNVRYEPES